MKPLFLLDAVISVYLTQQKVKIHEASLNWFSSCSFSVALRNQTWGIPENFQQHPAFFNFTWVLKLQIYVQLLQIVNCCQTMTTYDIWVFQHKLHYWLNLNFLSCYIVYVIYDLCALIPYQNYLLCCKVPCICASNGTKQLGWHWHWHSHIILCTFQLNHLVLPHLVHEPTWQEL